MVKDFEIGRWSQYTFEAIIAALSDLVDKTIVKIKATETMLAVLQTSGEYDKNLKKLVLTIENGYKTQLDLEAVEYPDNNAQTTKPLFQKLYEIYDKECLYLVNEQGSELKFDCEYLVEFGMERLKEREYVSDEKTGLFYLLQYDVLGPYANVVRHFEFTFRSEKKGEALYKEVIDLMKCHGKESPVEAAWKKCPIAQEIWARLQTSSISKLRDAEMNTKYKINNLICFG